MTQEFTRTLIKEYLQHRSPSNIEFEQSILETLIRDHEYDLVKYCLDNNFDTSKVLKYTIKYASPSFYDTLFSIEDIQISFYCFATLKSVYFHFNKSHEESKSLFLKHMKWASNNRDMMVHFAKHLWEDHQELKSSNKSEEDLKFCLQNIFLQYLNVDELKLIGFDLRLIFTHQHLYNIVKNKRLDILEKMQNDIPENVWKEILRLSLSSETKEIFKFALHFCASHYPRRDYQFVSIRIWTEDFDVFWGGLKPFWNDILPSNIKCHIVHEDPGRFLTHFTFMFK